MWISTSFRGSNAIIIIVICYTKSFSQYCQKSKCVISCLETKHIQRANNLTIFHMKCRTQYSSNCFLSNAENFWIRKKSRYDLHVFDLLKHTDLDSFLYSHMKMMTKTQTNRYTRIQWKQSNETD